MELLQALVFIFVAGSVAIDIGFITTQRGNNATENAAGVRPKNCSMRALKIVSQHVGILRLQVF